MTYNEISFALLKSIIADNFDAYVHLIEYKKRFGLFPKKPVDSSGCDSEVGSSNQMNEEMAKDRLKDLFEPLISLPCQ